MDPNTTGTDPQQAVVRNNRMVLLLIAGIPVTIILAATWLWFFVARGDLDLVGMLGTANRGSLVRPPRELPATALLEQDGAVFSYLEQDHRWTMLVAVPAGACDSRCEQSLYFTRQIHQALGKEFNRVRRISLGEAPVADMAMTVTELSDGRPAPTDFASYLDREQRDLTALIGPKGTYQAILPEYVSDHSVWYLVDPAGWIMMSYHEGISYKDVISDLKFLLKNSSE
jgi:hypothetical protein